MAAPGLTSMSQAFVVTAVIPARPRAIYDAWLDSRRHTAMTGARARIAGKVGGRYSAFDGYSWGVNLELVPGKRIVQSFRTTDFAERDPDSRVSVTLKKVRGGTRLTLRHSRLAAGAQDLKQGWREFYFAPMRAYFTARRAR
jgi:uncharacterized protein YndB with AHSA1/START domain